MIIIIASNNLKIEIRELILICSQMEVAHITITTVKAAGAFLTLRRTRERSLERSINVDDELAYLVLCWPKLTHSYQICDLVTL